MEVDLEVDAMQIITLASMENIVLSLTLLFRKKVIQIRI